MNPSVIKYVRLERKQFFYEDYTPASNLLMLVESGSFSLKTGNATTSAEACDCVFFQKGKQYLRKITSPAILHIFSMGEESPPIHNTVLHFHNKERILSNVALLNLLYQDIRQDDTAYLSHILADIIALYRYEIAVSVSSPKAKDPLVQQTANYLRENHAQKFNLTVLAAQADISYSQLLRRFKNSTGMTISQYLSHVRLSHAEHLLLNSDLKIREIAVVCGFENEYYFSNFYKKERGISPTAFRNSGRE